MSEPASEPLTQGDLERDLASVLATQAGHSDTDPRAALAEHERRLATRARTVRNRAVAGVVAAVAVIGVSAVLVVNRPDPSLPVATQPATTPATTPTAAATDLRVPEAARLADFTADGKQWTAYVMLTEIADSPCMLIVGVPVGEPPSSTDRYTDGQGCMDLKVHPGDPLIGQLSVLPATDNVPGPLPDVTVWVTVPAVAEISVVRSGGDTITASPLGTSAGVKLFATTEEIKFAKRYTFRDANGTVLRDDEF